ncbi:unnamed protein product [Heligmosomoides polygyrus]|uniref:Uncharacterized protein n=1 Tax=Heligmosomoides polygyrus TaxID=6339 RepID=A0A183FKS5_HELPZ|nr:unnamed protein product [Heligmosomoides polygyrus]
MARHPAMPVPIRMLSDRISEAYKSAALRKQPQSDVKGGTGYATKVTFDTQVKSQRTHGADAETGVKPTNMQKRFLIMTRLFKSKKDIPEYVAPGTMDRMHDRLRVVFIAVGVAVFFIIFYIAESINATRIARDRDAGVVVKSM